LSEDRAVLKPEEHQCCPTKKLEKRETILRLAIEKVLPEFAKACRDDVKALIIHQDGFAADYDEYELLGMAQSNMPDCTEKKSTSSAKTWKH